jgi:hypothetical protein
MEVEVEVVEAGKRKSSRSANSISNEDETGEEGEEVEDEEYEDEDDYDDAILFLPTGFSRPKPKTLYRGSDPEWQEFKKVASDRPRVEKIRSSYPDYQWRRQD